MIFDLVSLPVVCRAVWGRQIGIMAPVCNCGAVSSPFSVLSHSISIMFRFIIPPAVCPAQYHLLQKRYSQRICSSRHSYDPLPSLNCGADGTRVVQFSRYSNSGYSCIQRHAYMCKIACTCRQRRRAFNCNIFEFIVCPLSPFCLP